MNVVIRLMDPAIRPIVEALHMLGGWIDLHGVKVMNDKRTYLKIKLKSLAEEARIIRKEERKVHGESKWNLQFHRKTIVRDEARRSLIAYQIVRGKDPAPHYSQDSFVRRCDVGHVERMVKRYGSPEVITGLPGLLRHVEDGDVGSEAEAA